MSNKVNILLSLIFAFIILNNLAVGPTFSVLPKANIRITFNLPSDIAVDSRGFIYVADTLNHRIQKIKQDGTFLTQWGEKGTMPGQFKFPVGVAVDIKDNVYVADRENLRIQKFTSTGTYVTGWNLVKPKAGGDLSKPNALDVDSGGNVYVTVEYASLNPDMTISRGAIQKYSNSGVFLGVWVPPPDTYQEFWPRGIDVNVVCNLLVKCKFFHERVLATDIGNSRILIYSKEGNVTGGWGSWGDGKGQFKGPGGITGDLLGFAFYISDTNNNRIQRITHDGQFLLEWGSEGEGKGQFRQPEGITVDSKGYVYVADSGNDRIQVFKLSDSCRVGTIQIKSGVCFLYQLGKD